jgi:hypothetical protein
MAIDRRQLGSSRQWALLGVLLVVLAGVLWMRRGGDPAPANAGSRTSNVQGRTAGRSPDQDLDVRIEALTAERTPPAEIERNPFRFEARRRPQADQPQQAPAPSSEPAPSAPSGPPPPAPIPLKFIGIIESAGVGRMAALTDGKHVFHGRVGDNIEGRYRIVRIGVESIVLERVEDGSQQTIRMSGS